MKLISGLLLTLAIVFNVAWVVMAYMAIFDDGNENLADATGLTFIIGLCLGAAYAIARSSESHQ